MTKSSLFARGFRLLVRDPAIFCDRVKHLLRPSRKEYRSRLNMRLGNWLQYHQKKIIFDQCYWMGVHAYKNPLDAWIYQEIIYRVQPDILLEIGSAEGGSTLYFANLFDLIGKGSVISIDLDRTKWRVTHSRVTTITGDSSAPEIINQVSRLCQNKSVMVIQDGDHSKAQVLRDLNSYWHLVTLGSYFIVEDGVIDILRPGEAIKAMRDGPLTAVEEFLKSNNSFVVDEECERYLLTSNPKGYLKRIN